MSVAVEAHTSRRMSDTEIETSPSEAVTSEDLERQIRTVTDRLTQQLAHLCQLMKDLRDTHTHRCHEKTASSRATSSSTGGTSRSDRKYGAWFYFLNVWKSEREKNNLQVFQKLHHTIFQFIVCLESYKVLGSSKTCKPHSGLYYGEFMIFMYVRHCMDSLWHSCYHVHYHIWLSIYLLFLYGGQPGLCFSR